MPKQNIHLALFDVRQKNRPGGFALAKVVNLRPSPKPSLSSPIPRTSPPKKEKLEVASHRDIIAAEIERAFEEKDLMRVLPKPQPIVVPEPAAIPQPVVIPEPAVVSQADLTLSENSSVELKNFWESPTAQEVDKWLEGVKTRRISTNARRRTLMPGKKFIASMIVAALVLSGIAAAFFVSSEFVVGKEEKILKNGSSAAVHLEKAKESLQEFDFSSAANSFALAHDDFAKASGAINGFGGPLLSLIGEVSGLEKVKSARNLAQAGQHISKSGEYLSRGLLRLGQIDFFRAINSYSSKDGGESLVGPIEDFRGVLEFSRQSMEKAGDLLDDVEASSIPGDKRAMFENFRDKIPEFRTYIGQAVKYSDFLLGFVGKHTGKNYLVLLQNTSEKRPTGGFPGTYAIISFDRGTLTKVFLDDVYNIDGQIKENMIPPGPLQHITPNWGMRDANWFADFPTSAKKVEEYYRLDGGADLDGVLAVTPTVIERILRISGPIEMSEYGVTLDADNFLAEIQNEVEYGENRNQPKSIVADFQPKFFAKLAEQDRGKWIEIIKALFTAIEEKHILAYFNDPDLQKNVLAGGLGGEIKKTNGDYLQVVFSNVKGSKSDAVTANSMKFEADLKDGGSARKLTVTRIHSGGGSSYKFYNRENAAYVKVYVPGDSELKKIEGNSDPDYEPLVDHQALGFKEDQELAAIEAGMEHPFDGVDVFEESGKTVFGFWMITKPGKATSVTVSYIVSAPLAENSYSLYWQKQSGSDGDMINVNVILPEGARAESATVYDGILNMDREFGVVYH